jgi:hypothetical protein
MVLDDNKMKWVSKITKSAKVQEEKDAVDAQKALLLDQLAEAREKDFATILEGVQIQIGGRDEKGRIQAEAFYREDADGSKTADVRDDYSGKRVTDASGKKIEGELSDAWLKGKARGDEVLKQPEFEKNLKALHLVEALALPLEKATVDGKDKKGKAVKKPMFTKEELTAEIYDPLVRRGVPETFIGDKHSRTHDMVKGTFEAYGERLEKEDLKGLYDENKDLGLALLKMCIALPGAVMSADGATKLLASQQQASTDPIHVFQQNFGISANDTGDYADNLQKAVQAWALIQTVADAATEGVPEVVKSTGELLGKKGAEEESDEEEGEGHKHHDRERAKRAPLLTQGVIAGVALNVGRALVKLGPVGSTILGSVIKRANVTALLAKKDLKAADIKAIVDLLADGISKALDTLSPGGGVDLSDITQAKKDAKSALDTLDADKVVTALKDGKFEDAISAFNVVAQSAGKALESKLSKFLAANQAAMKAKASEYVSEQLKDAAADSKKPEDKKHKEEKGHDPDWVEMNGKSICFRCPSDTKDVALFAGILEMKITRMKRDTAYFQLAVNIGGMAFDVATNFLAPLAMGGALLRMTKFIFEAVKRWIDYSNFCDNAKAMTNAACIYSPAVKRFRDDAARQGLYYSINAACEGVKIVGAIVNCTPGVIGGIIASQAATGVEAVTAVLYEIAKREQLAEAWKTYKDAINHPENRRIAQVAIRKNPTLTKYAVAWGAIIEEDPLVGDFMAYCGVNADNLKGNAGIDKVVEYLEARMPDDIEVVGRRYAANADWAPAKVELTTDSWIDAKARGETEGGVAKIDTSAIESALTTYEAALQKLEDAKTDPPAKRKTETEAVLKCLVKVSGALRAYVPKDAKRGGEVEGMVEVKDLFLSNLKLKRKALKADLETIEAEIKKQATAPKASAASHP